METIKVEMDVPKEGKEIVDFVGAVLDKVMAKAPLADYATLLSDILPAVDGVGKIGEELKSSGRDELAGYLVKVVMDKLLPGEEAAE
jgi:hypothetical protein